MLSCSRNRKAKTFFSCEILQVLLSSILYQERSVQCVPQRLRRLHFANPRRFATQGVGTRDISLVRSTRHLRGPYTSAGPRGDSRTNYRGCVLKTWVSIYVLLACDVCCASDVLIGVISSTCTLRKQTTVLASANPSCLWLGRKER